MGKPYLDLRERTCAYVAIGNSAPSTAPLFGVSAATWVRLAAEDRDHGMAIPKLQGALPVSSANLPRTGIIFWKLCRPNRTPHSRKWPPPLPRHILHSKMIRPLIAIASGHPYRFNPATQTGASG